MGNYTFEKDYNSGTITNKVPVPKQTGSVIIHVAKVVNAAGTIDDLPKDDHFFLDYIFPLSGGLEDAYGYFVYDPAIKVVDIEAEKQREEDAKKLKTDRLALRPFCLLLVVMVT